MVYFEDNFWGEKNNGYEVLYHTMKHGINSSRELAEFIRDRATIEEGYAKSLSKICKPTNTGLSLGTFDPCWTIVKSSTEILANSYTQAVQQLHELIKVVRDYTEAQKEGQKSLKDDLTATSDVVTSFQNKTAAVLKAKETYYSRCQEFEKVKKETTNAKDIEKAEQKKIRAGDEYKSLIEKREEARKMFHSKMIETSKKFEEIEVNHLKCMSDHLITYIGTLERGNVAVQEVIAHFRTQVKELTSDKLLEQFAKDKGTGRDVPVEIMFEEFAATGSLVDIEVEASPNLNIRTQSISAFRKKRKDKDKDKETKEKKERKTKKKKEKDKVQTPNGTIEASPNANTAERLPGNDDGAEVDEEGYRIIPKDTESHKSDKSNESSDSDSDDEDEPKKIKITIKPATEKTTASLDEFRSIQLTLPTPPVWQKKSESTSSDDFPKTSLLNGSGFQSQKLSKSQEDLLSIDFSQPAFSNTSATTTTNQLTNFSTLSPLSPNSGQVLDLDKPGSGDNDDKPPALAPKKKISSLNRNYSNEFSPALPPKKLSVPVFGSTGSLGDTSAVADKESTSDESRHSPPDSLSFLAPPPTEMTRTTSAGSLSIPASRPRPKPRLSAAGTELHSSSLSLKNNFDPTRTNGSPTPTTTTETASGISPDVQARVSDVAGTAGGDDPVGSPKTIWDKINSPGTQRALRGNTSPVFPVRGIGNILQPTMVNTSGGLKKNEEIIPVAVALVETVNAHFKGKDTLRHGVTGDITVSFPASAINSLSSSEDPPVLTFAITGSILLENITPNKTLILSDEPPGDRGAKYFKFKMSALVAHLKKLAEQGQAPYYNIDILKYEVQHDLPLVPLALSCYWRCEEKTTDVKVDYQYTPSCLSAISPLNNVSVVVPVNGGVEIMQSKPMAKWSKEHNKALWMIPELSNNSEGQGPSSLRARFELSEGPSVPQTIVVQFQCNGSTLSKIDFQLNTDMYKLSLVKRKIVTGKYMADPR